MQIFYLAFGEKQEIYQQNYLSVVSLLKKHPKADISIITDHPEKFARLQPHIELISPPTTEIKSWFGQHQYLYRAKCKAFELMAARYPNTDLLFLDADIYIQQPLDNIAALLKQGHVLLHKPEAAISQTKRKMEQSMWENLGNKLFNGIKITKQSVMWNSGVIGMPAKKCQALSTQVIKVLDEMLNTSAKPKTLEQFAFSVVFTHEGSLLKAYDPFIHYWGSKHLWQQKITLFMTDSLLLNRSVIEDIAALDDDSFTVLPIMDRPQNSNKRFKALVDKYFNKRTTFFHQNKP